uniref:Uncharacterized protein n=1 Tax=Cucumis sativus TaxID=3659 RepID=A0A0A0LE36_CUCSA
MHVVVDDSRLDGASYAGVVHHDVELAEGFDCSFNRILDLGFVCDIAVDIEGVGPAKHGGIRCMTEVVLDGGDGEQRVLQSIRRSRFATGYYVYFFL